MNNKIQASVKTFGKYLFWTAVAAAAISAANTIGNLGIPDIIVPFLAAAFKSLATYAATEAGQ